MPPDLAERVAAHLVAAGRVLDEDPELAYRHAVAARRRASRVGAVREAAGVAAYFTGRYGEAIRDLRAARRMTGSDAYLVLIADAERGLGRPERALTIARSPEVSRLELAAQAEMSIVASGARRDLGQFDAAVSELRGQLRRSAAGQPWAARLLYAYADALLTAGRAADAVEAFRRALAADDEGMTDAGDRLAELEGVRFVSESDLSAGQPGDGAGTEL